jgi:DNA invertase Pin-like site-specific DNA recombinase
LERAITRERQVEGIRAAEARGVYQFRIRKLTAEHLATARELMSKGVPKAEIARRFNVDRSTLYRTLGRPPLSDGR